MAYLRTLGLTNQYILEYLPLEHVDGLLFLHQIFSLERERERVKELFEFHQYLFSVLKRFFSFVFGVVMNLLRRVLWWTCYTQASFKMSFSYKIMLMPIKNHSVSDN